MGVPLDLVAKQQGFNIIGYFADDQPNFQFNVYIVKRSWAEKNRPLVVRFMKAMASTMRWMVDNRDAACAYLIKEMAISVEHCRYASDYNWKNRIWDRNADLNVEGVRTIDQYHRGARDSERAAAAAVEVHRSELSQAGAGGSGQA